MGRLEVVIEPFKLALMDALSKELNCSTYAKESLTPSFDQGTLKSKMQAIFDGSGSKQKAMPKQAHNESPVKIAEVDAVFNPPKVMQTGKVPKPIGLARFRKCEVLVELARSSSAIGGKSSGEDKSEVDMEMESSSATEVSETENPAVRPASGRSTFRRRTYFRER